MIKYILRILIIFLSLISCMHGTLTLDNITDDNDINATEATQTIQVTGSADGNNSISFEVYGTPYSTNATNGSWVVDVNGLELANDTNFTITDLNTSEEVNASHTVHIDFDLNLANVNLSEHNITNIQYFGQNGNDNNFSIPDSGTLSDGNTTITVTIDNFDQNFSFRFDTNNTTNYWYNFSDKNLYKYKNENDYFKSKVNSANHQYNISLVDTNWHNFIDSYPSLIISQNAVLDNDISITTDLNVTSGAIFDLGDHSINAQNINVINSNFTTNTSSSIEVYNNLNISTTGSLVLPNTLSVSSGNIVISATGNITFPTNSMNLSGYDANISSSQSMYNTHPVKIIGTLNLKTTSDDKSIIFSSFENNASAVSFTTQGSSNISNVVYNSNSNVNINSSYIAGDLNISSNSGAYINDSDNNTTVVNGAIDLNTTGIVNLNNSANVFHGAINANVGGLTLHNSVASILGNITVGANGMTIVSTGNITDSGTINISAGNPLNITGSNITFTHAHYFGTGTTNITAGSVTLGSNISALGSSSQININGDLTINADTDINANLSINGNLTITDNITFNVTQKLSVSGTITKGTNSTLTYGSMFNTFHNKIYPIELEITSAQYEDANSTDLNNTSLFALHTMMDINQNIILEVNQILLLNDKSYESKTEISSSGFITKNKKYMEPLTKDVNNTITIKDKLGTTPISKIKYVRDIDNSELTDVHYAHDINVTFDSNSMGYLIYEQQQIDECYIHSIRSNDSSSFISEHTYDGNNSGNKYLLQNRYNHSKVLMFDTTNTLIEFNDSNSTTNSAGTYQKTTNNISCKDINNNDALISMDELIELNTTVDGYSHQAFAYKGSAVYEVEYRKEGDARSIYLLDSNASKTLATTFDFTIAPTIQKVISDDWTYLSLPSSNLLCTSSYQTNLTDLCDQNNTIESLFSSNYTVLKHTGSWSYWDSNSSLYQDKDGFASIDPREGIFIKTKTKTTLNIPYNVFDKPSVKSISLYQDGWYLINAGFTSNVDEIKTMVESQSKILKYILQLKSGSWNIYAPTNDSEIDSSIPRMSVVDTASSFWIYVD